MFYKKPIYATNLSLFLGLSLTLLFLKLFNVITWFELIHFFSFIALISCIFFIGYFIAKLRQNEEINTYFNNIVIGIVSGIVVLLFDKELPKEGIFDIRFFSLILIALVIIIFPLFPSLVRRNRKNIRK